MTTNIPLVSIIIPCYNQGNFLSAALESVLCQSYSHWECIIVNDGSYDTTEQVIKAYLAKDGRFKYVKTLNSGLAASRNKGIQISKGDYIQFLDADDLLEQHKLKHAIDLYLSHLLENKLIIYSSMRYFEDGLMAELKIVGRDQFIAHVEIKQQDSIDCQRELLVIRNPFVISAPVYPSLVFTKTGPFDVSLTALEDWDFHLRCNQTGYRFHHHYAPDGGTLIRLHNKSMMRNQKLLDKNFFALLNKHELLKPTPMVKIPVVSKIMRAITPPILEKLLIRLKKIITYGF